MARKIPEKPAATSVPKISPDKPVRARKTPPKTDVVKVANGRVVKTPPAKAVKKAPAKRRKPAATKPLPDNVVVEKPAPRKRAAPGNTRARKSVKLNENELQALQAGALHGLDERQAKFVDMWLVTQNGTQSYLDAGFECKSDAVAAAAASRLLRKVKEHPYTKAKRAELFSKTEEITNRVIERVYGAALADPRELVEYVYRCCRHCYGVGFGYQMTPRQIVEREASHAAAVAEAKATKQPVPGKLDMLGGGGFDARLDPHPDCPECFGEGRGLLVLKDTRHLSPAALAIYGGVKQTKDGLEMKIVDQRPYLELLGRIFNMNIEPVVPVSIGVSKAELDAALARGLAKTQEQRNAMAERQRQIAELDDDGGAAQ